MFKSKVINTKTILADIILKRGLRKDVTSLREGELGYIKDEKKIVVGTIDSIEDIAMKKDILNLFEEQEKKFQIMIENFEREMKAKEVERLKNINNTKVLERITNKDVNEIKGLNNKFITREELTEMLKTLDRDGDR